MSKNESRYWRILVVEDDREHRDGLCKELRARGHAVIAFRDVETLRRGLDDGLSWASHYQRYPLVVVLDVMLAYSLDPEAECAPRWDGPDLPPEPREWVDDEMGVELAREIRQGKYDAIPKDAPIVLLTARNNPEIVERGKKLQCIWLTKPAWTEDVENALNEAFGLVEASPWD